MSAPSRLASVVVGLLAFTAACGGSGSSSSEGQPSPSTTVTTAAPTSTTTVPKVRSVALGEAFSVRVGESVDVAGAGVSVTYTALVSDSRCPVGVQCIQAGRAVISVTVTRPGSAPATLTLGTDMPRSARAGARTVELVTVGRLTPIAQLKVT